MVLKYFLTILLSYIHQLKKNMRNKKRDFVLLSFENSLLMKQRLLSVFLLGSLLFLGGKELWAQDAHFSQYYANPLYLNPAFAGVAKCPKVHMNYRNQYPIGNVFNTYSVSYDQYFDKLRGGLGILLLRDDAGNGALTNTEASLIYSHHLKVSREFTILAGFQTTFRQRAISWNDFRFPDQIDPFFGFVLPTEENRPPNEVNSHLDLSFGLIGYTKNFYFGVTGNHVTQPDEGFFVDSRLPFKLTGHLGASIPLGRQRTYNETQPMLIPNLVYQWQGSFMSYFGGLSFNYSAITGGLGYRHGNTNPDAVVILLGLAPQELPFRIGYSYDYTVSRLTNALGGAHEISILYQFPCIQKRQRIPNMSCPKF